ncbi:MAG: hypothetical protein ACRD1Y_10700 [Terriglobales bacterium]
MRGICLRLWIVVSLAALALAQAPSLVWSGPAQLQSTGAKTPLGGPLNAAAVATGANGAPVIWVGGDGGVWAFEPTQSAWATTALSKPVAAVAVSSCGTIYAATASSVMASTNGGQSWSVLGGGTLAATTVAQIAVDPSSCTHLLVAAQNGLYPSGDGGTTWTQLLSGDYGAIAWQGTNVLVAGASGVELSTASAAAGSFAAVATLPASWAGVGVAAASGSGFLALFAQSDGTGSLWTISDVGAAAQVSSLSSLHGQQSLALVVDAKGNIWAGGTGLSLSSDGGKTWSALSGTGSEQHAIAVNPTGGVVVADESGLWSAQAPATVANLNIGLQNAAPLGIAVAAGDVLAGLDSGGIATGATGTGADWSVGTAPAKFTQIVANPAAASAYYALGNGQLWQSSNAGSTWTQATVSNLSGAPTALASSASGVWVGTSDGHVLPLGGASPPAQPASAAIDALAVAGSQIWAATSTTLYISADGGSTWTSANAPAVVTALAADPVQTDLLALASAAGVQLSTDGGTSWSSVEALAGGVPVTALLFDAKQTLWAATQGRGLWSAALADYSSFVSATAPPSTATAGTAVSLQAKLQQWGSAVSGAVLEFAPSVGGASQTPVNATADAAGVATASISESQAGTVTVLISAPDDPNTTTATVTYTVAAAAPAKLSMVSNLAASATVGANIPLELEVEDSFGNPVSGATVTLSGATFQNASVVTDSAGHIQTQATLPNVPGSVTMTATVAGVAPLQWTIQVTPLPDFQLDLTPPSTATPPGQNAVLQLSVVGQNGFQQPVTLACLQPVGGCTVTPGQIAPGATAQVSVNTSGNQTSMNVIVQGSVGALMHTQSATVALEAFTLNAASGNTLQVEAGSSGALPLALTSENGLAGAATFQVTMAGGGTLPASLAAAFDPSTAALTSSTTPVKVQLAISAASGGAAAAGPLFGGGPWLWLVLGLLGTAWAWERRKKWGRLGAVAGLVCLLAGCGGGGLAAIAPPPPPQTATYDLQVTAAVGPLQASVPVTVTVTTP